MNLKTTCFAALAILSLLTTSLFAQTETGQITGNVVDPSGPAIPKATVTVKNVGTGATRTFTTDSSGTYLVPNLPPREYQLMAAAAGFATTQQRATVAVGSKVSVDLHLQIGAASQLIEVTEHALQVNAAT